MPTNISIKRYRKKGNFRKPAQKSSKRKSNFRSLVSSKGLFIIPPRIRNKVALSFTATLATGFMAGTGTYFVSYANMIYQPFNTSSATMTAAFTLTQGSLISNSPIGYSVLSSQYYRYKVLNVTYDLQLVCGSNQDTMAVSMYPFLWPTGTAGLNPWNSASQPGSVHKVMNQSGASSNENRLLKTYNIRKYLGLTKTQYDSLSDTENDQLPDQLLGINFGFEPLNATVNAQPVSFMLTATYDVEWSSPIRNTN